MISRQGAFSRAERPESSHSNSNGVKKSSKLKKLTTLKDFKLNSRSISPNIDPKISTKGKEAQTS